MVTRPAHSLRRKIVTTILVVLASTFGLISVFLLWQNTLILRERIQAQAATTAHSVESTIRTVMIGGRGDLASEVLERLRTIPEFRRVQVFRANGVEAFHDFATLMDVVSVLRARGESERARELFNRIRASARDDRRPARLHDPAFLKAVATGHAVTRSETVEGERVLTYFLPVRNEEACQQCHRPEPAVRGVIVLSLATSPLRAGLYRGSATLLASLAVTALAIGAGLVLSLRRTVLRPIESLAGALAAPDPARALGALPPSPTQEFATLASTLRTSIERTRAAQVEVERMAGFPRFSPNPILEVTADGGVLYANTAARMFQGRLGLTTPEALLPPAISRVVAECLGTGAARVAEATVSGRTLAWRFFPIADGAVVYGYAEDVTDRLQAETALRQKEEQLRQSQKMEAIGQLAGGVAHDFNNLLTVVVGHADLVLQRLEEEHPSRRHVANIRHAAERATALTHDLLAFSRKQVLQPAVLDLNAVLASLGPMLERLIGEHIELVTAPATRVGCVRADAGQLDQVLMNLVVNARDAMPEGGRLTIATGEVDLDERRAAAHAGARTGRHALLSVSDTGLGMDAATQARIFEPFFTTKEPGRGTGLGLSTVYGIVSQSGGSIEVESTPGRGTTFKIYLPVVDAAVPLPATPPEVTPPDGSERVFLVEDEEGVRDLARAFLEEAGYSVVTAINGRDAIDVFARHGGEFDLLVTDVVMPHLDGRRLAERLVAERPDMRVLYMSGYANQAVVHQTVLDSGTAFVQKPFTMASLTARVRDALDAPVAEPV
jgi:signal transduction histidine kinase/ActR/RegA family two-component response regulator